MPSSGCSTATNATSLISCTTSWLGWPVIADLNLRGRFASDASPMNREVISSICGVGSMSSSAAMPATGEPSTTRGHVAARLGGAESDGLEAAPDLGHRLDLDPVQLDVLAVGQVGGVAAELGRDAGDDAQLLGGQLAAVDADAQHEVLVLELVRLEGRGAAAVDAGLALRVQAPHAEAAVQIGRVDRREAALRVDVLDALAHREAVVDLLPLLVAVERSRCRRSSTARWAWTRGAAGGPGHARRAAARAARGSVSLMVTVASGCPGRPRGGL